MKLERRYVGCTYAVLVFLQLLRGTGGRGRSLFFSYEVVIGPSYLLVDYTGQQNLSFVILQKADHPFQW